MGTSIAVRGAPLTTRELEVLNGIKLGGSNAQIAGLMGVGEQTVKNYVSVILVKLDAQDRAHAVYIGIQQGVIT